MSLHFFRQYDPFSRKPILLSISLDDLSPPFCFLRVSLAKHFLPRYRPTTFPSLFSVQLRFLSLCTQNFQILGPQPSRIFHPKALSLPELLSSDVNASWWLSNIPRLPPRAIAGSVSPVRFEAPSFIFSYLVPHLLWVRDFPR